MRKGWFMAGIAAFVVFLIAYAWIDGGREPVRLIVQPIPVPEMPK